jgi:hypothetical protein
MLLKADSSIFGYDYPHSVKSQTNKSMETQRIRIFNPAIDESVLDHDLMLESNEVVQYNSRKKVGGVVFSSSSSHNLEFESKQIRMIPDKIIKNLK